MADGALPSGSGSQDNPALATPDVAVLVSWLANGGRGPKALSAATALATKAGGPQAQKDHVVAAGGLLALASVLENPDAPVAVSAAAAKAIASLAVDRQARKDAVVASGALPSLVRIYNAEKDSTSAEGLEAKRACARALAGISCGVLSSREAMLDAGGLQVILDLLQTPPDAEDQDAVLKIQATSAVSQLCRGTPALKEGVMASGVISMLVKILVDHTAIKDTGSEAMDIAADILAHLASTDTATRQAIVAADGLPALANLLQKIDSSMFCRQPNAEWSVRESAIEAVSELAADEHLCGALISAQILPILLRLLRSRSTDKIIKQTVISAICNLAGGGPAAESAVLTSGVIPTLLALLSATKRSSRVS
eukprot:scaffold38259_cov46-Prasinocladus_malaysianus.AAC.2